METFIGQIVMFGGNFAPRSWSLCDGQLMPISQWSALFSILGTMYGGDGRTTFALPDMRSRVPVHAGQGPGLSDYRQGPGGGTERVTLSTSQIPSHNHTAEVVLGGAGTATIGTNNLFATNAGVPIFSSTATSNKMSTSSVSVQNMGGGQSHTNIQPYCVVQFIMAMQGTYPSRN